MMAAKEIMVGTPTIALTMPYSAAFQNAAQPRGAGPSFVGLPCAPAARHAGLSGAAQLPASPAVRLAESGKMQRLCRPRAATRLLRSPPHSVACPCSDPSLAAAA
jgi:hypothetical protein